MNAIPTSDIRKLGSEVLRERGFPETLIRAILSHADYTGVRRESLMEHALFATDELCGFLVACALVRPDRSFDTLEVSFGQETYER
jgi:predicted hydrolase (HD superfamily)